MNKKMRKNQNNKGFSLVELIVVIAIMAILAVTLAPRLSQYIEKSRVASDQEAVNSIFTAARMANAESPLPNSTSLLLNSAYNVTDSGRTWDENDAYSYTGYPTFSTALLTTLSSFKLKSSAVNTNATITVATSTSGAISITLDRNTSITTDDLITAHE